MAVRRRDRAAIRSLRRADVVSTLETTRRFIRVARWLGKTNRCALNPIAKIGADGRARTVREPKQLSQYIAVSTLLHATDGWSYLGKAILALLRGDPHRCRHLAYYAELRAAMSLLAAEGIGVFKNRHFVIDAPNSVLKLECREGTHDFVSSCLEYWSVQAKSGQLFADIINPNGCVLSDWLMPIGGSGVVAAQIQQWLMQWGMDLRLFSDDRDARNESSYRPDGIPEAWFLDADSSLQFVRELWGAFEPAPNSRFDEIDRQILRLSLESTFKAQTGVSASENLQRYDGFVAPIIEHQAMGEEARRSWGQFLSRRVLSKDSSIFVFSRETPDVLKTSHFSILSRAALLLRLATGSTTKLFRDAGIDGDSIAFWWQRLGHGRGLWEGEKQPNDLIDLWADIEALLQSVEAFQADNETASQTFFLAGNILHQALIGLGSCERVPIWSIV
jgi:hypothetical protein